MGVLQLLFGSRADEPTEPNLQPEDLEAYRQLSSAERRRIMAYAEREAKASVAFDPTRDFIEQRDAYIALEVSGFNRRVSALIQDKARNPGKREGRWSVIVGQDEPPDGLWGWAIIEAHRWPAKEIGRRPVAFATKEEARLAGEAAADALWIEVNRKLAQG